MKKLIILLSFILINNNFDKKFCDIKGSVKNPGVYEIKENYTISDVIELAGGLNNDAYTDNINLSKKVSDEMVIYIFEKSYIKKINSLNNCECSSTYNYVECPKTTTTSIKTSALTTTITKNVTTATKDITNKNQEIIKGNRITTSHIEKPTTTQKKQSTTTQKITTAINSVTSQRTTTKLLELININTADKELLCTLKGLGEKKAQSIIEYRNAFGLFNSIEEIMNVSGIGESTFEKIKNFIKV